MSSYLLLFKAGLKSGLLLEVFLILLVIVDELSEGEALLSSSLEVVVELAANDHNSVELVSFLIFNAEILQ